MTTITDRLTRICDFQGDRGFILTGFYLEPHELVLIRGALTRDDPDVGAEGRFKGVPVFEKLDKLEEDFASEGSIDYTFVKMGVVDLGEPVD